MTDREKRLDEIEEKQVVVNIGFQNLLLAEEFEWIITELRQAWEELAILKKPRPMIHSEVTPEELEGLPDD